MKRIRNNRPSEFPAKYFSLGALVFLLVIAGVVSNLSSGQRGENGESASKDSMAPIGNEYISDGQETKEVTEGGAGQTEGNPDDSGIAMNPSENISNLPETIPDLPENESNTDMVDWKDCNIRVLIKSDSYKGLYHDSPEITSDEPFRAILYQYRDGELWQLSETIFFEKGDIFIPSSKERYSEWEEKLQDGAFWRVQTESVDGCLMVAGLVRNQGSPKYEGFFDIYQTSEGWAIVNELPMERYLCYVLPSEMPSDYPMESLKAQAVCARTYAMNYLDEPAYASFHAHLDDSSSFQVYQNIDKTTRSEEAVLATAGERLFYEGEAVETYFYSTSCGMGTDITAWKSEKRYPYLNARLIAKHDAAGSDGGVNPNELTEEEFADFILQPPDCYESNFPWFRWTYEATVTKKDMEESLKECYRLDPSAVLTKGKDSFSSKEIGTPGALRSIEIYRRSPGGAVSELLLVFENDTYLVQKESMVRRVLRLPGGYAVRADGVVVDSEERIPSAFFIPETVQKGKNVIAYTLTGGGHGHGIGMSQNGACAMATDGVTYTEILSFFYPGSEIRRVK